jgi:hypothetical protein
VVLFDKLNDCADNDAGADGNWAVELVNFGRLRSYYVVMIVWRD